MSAPFLGSRRRRTPSRPPVQVSVGIRCETWWSSDVSAWSQTSRNGSWAKSGLRSASSSCVQAPAICSIAAQFEAVTSRVSIPLRSLRNLRSAFMADVLPLLLAPTSRVCLSDMSRRARRNLRKLKTSMRVSFIISVPLSQELPRWCLYIYLSCGFVAVLDRQGLCQS